MLKMFLAVLVLFSALACGPFHREPRPEPSYPSKVWGWEEHKEMGVNILGDFVLKVGDQTDNGQIRIKLLKVYGGDRSADPNDSVYRATATLQFTLLPNQQTVCEDVFTERVSGRTSKCEKLLLEIGISSVSISAINIKDGWAHIDLAGWSGR